MLLKNWLSFLLPLLALLFSVGAQAEQRPPLWGYGVKSCDNYAAAWKGREEGVDRQIAEYRRYEDWLTGFVSGINLATGQDVLVGVEIDSAMRRIYLHCDENRKDDFFASTMDLVRLLSQLK